MYTEQDTWITRQLNRLELFNTVWHELGHVGMYMLCAWFSRVPVGRIQIAVGQYQVNPQHFLSWRADINAAGGIAVLPNVQSLSCRQQWWLTLAGPLANIGLATIFGALATTGFCLVPTLAEQSVWLLGLTMVGVWMAMFMMYLNITSAWDSLQPDIFAREGEPYQFNDGAIMAALRHQDLRKYRRIGYNIDKQTLQTMVSAYQR